MREIGGVKFECFRQGLWISKDRGLCIVRMPADAAKMQWELWETLGPSGFDPDVDPDDRAWWSHSHLDSSTSMCGLERAVRTAAAQKDAP